MTSETATARAVLALTVTLLTWVVFAMVRTMIYFVDTPRRRRAARRSERRGSP